MNGSQHLQDQDHNGHEATGGNSKLAQVARAEKERLRIQEKTRKEALEKIRNEQNSLASLNEVRPCLPACLPSRLVFYTSLDARLVCLATCECCC